MPDSGTRGGDRKLLLPVLFLASFAVLCAGALVKGPFVSVDTQPFLNTGEDILEWLITGEAAFEDLRRPAMFPQYLISSVFLAGIHTYLDLREWGVMLANCVLFASIVCAVFSAWRAIYVDLDHPWDRTAGLAGICGGMYVIFGLPDGFLWSYAILSDVLFLFWITLFTGFVVRGFVDESRPMWVLAFMAAVTAPFVRPPGIVVPLLYCLALALYAGPVRRRSFKYFAAGIVAAPAVLVLVVVPWLVLTYAGHGAALESDIPYTLRRAFHQSMIFFEKGIIISNRVEMEPAGPLSYNDILQTIGYRLAYYWIPVRFGEDPYSAMHNGVNAIYMLLALPLLILGINNLRTMGRRYRTLMLFLVVVAYSYALLHAVTLVSFDWRYQLPAMVPLWILAGCGFFGLLGFRPRAGEVD